MNGSFCVYYFFGNNGDDRTLLPLPRHAKLTFEQVSVHDQPYILPSTAGWRTARAD
jgi:hypothetical protein